MASQRLKVCINRPERLKQAQAQARHKDAREFAARFSQRTSSASERFVQ